MSIYDDLRQDHDQVKALLSEIERTSRTMLCPQSRTPLRERRSAKVC